MHKRRKKEGIPMVFKITEYLFFKPFQVSANRSMGVMLRAEYTAINPCMFPTSNKLFFLKNIYIIS